MFKHSSFKHYEAKRIRVWDVWWWFQSSSLFDVSRVIMKWYSVKQFSPPISTYCLIFTENNYTYVARLESKDTPDVWIHDYHCEECENSAYENICGVTHFAIIEPVEIDE